MRSLNLFSLSRVTYPPFFSGYEKQLSQRKEPLKNVKANELESLRILVDQLSYIISGGGNGNNIDLFEHFYYSFSIEKISKEFDLLRLAKNYIINIELKSQMIAEEKIKKQLDQNCYYLEAVNRFVHEYTYVSNENLLFYRQDDGELVQTSLESLVADLRGQCDFYDGEIDDLFCASQYLISPMNTPERFLNDEYFLTGQQEEIENSIIALALKGKPISVGITGKPGTGKTLLIYDLAKKISTIFGKICIIHCGTMPDGLIYLNDHLSMIDIIPVRKIRQGFLLSEYSFVIIDESQRMWPNHFNLILEQVKECGASIIFSFDPNQTMSSSEVRNEIDKQIQSIEGVVTFKLKNKIRTNRQLASFIQRLLGKHVDEMFDSYPDAQIIFANTVSEAQLIIEDLKEQNYTFINYSGSNYNYSHFTAQYSGDYDTHHVIGQEYEKVVMVIDKTFGYDEQNRLRAREHPNPDYLYVSLLYQGLSRVRSKLAIIVVQDYPLFEKIMDKFNLIEGQ